MTSPSDVALQNSQLVLLPHSPFNATETSVYARLLSWTAHPSTQVIKYRWIEGRLLIFHFLRWCFASLLSDSAFVEVIPTQITNMCTSNEICESWIHCFFAPPFNRVAVCVSRHYVQLCLRPLSPSRLTLVADRVIVSQPVGVLSQLSLRGKSIALIHWAFTRQSSLSKFFSYAALFSYENCDVYWQLK